MPAGYNILSYSETKIIFWFYESHVTTPFPFDKDFLHTPENISCGPRGYAYPRLETPDLVVDLTTCIDKCKSTLIQFIS